MSNTILVEQTNPPEDKPPVERLILSTTLEHPYEPPTITIAVMEHYSVTLHRLIDGQTATSFELSGLEVERLIRGYRIHARRYSRAVCKMAEAACQTPDPDPLGDLDNLDDHPF